MLEDRLSGRRNQHYGRRIERFIDAAAELVANAPNTCALDVATRGGHGGGGNATERGEATLKFVGVLFKLTRERVRQIEAKAFKSARAAVADGVGADKIVDPR